MALTKVQREWLSKVIKIPKDAPDDKVLLKARLDYFIDSESIEAQIEATEDENLKQQLTDLKKRSPASEQELEKAITDAKNLLTSASNTLLKLQEDLLKKLEEYQPALLEAKTIINAVNSQPKKDDLGVETKETGQKLEFQRLAEAQKVVDKYGRAIALQKQHKYDEAVTRLGEGLKAYKELNTEGLRNDLKKEVENAKSEEEHAFRLFVGDEKDMRKLVASPKVLDLLQDGITDSDSPALKEMHRIFEKCLMRFDKLKTLGVKPYDAADIAFANIPRAFWPDRAIREIDMFLRVEQAMETELAERVGENVSQGANRFLEIYEYPKLGTDTVSDEMTLALKMGLKIPGNKKLPEKGTKDYEKLSPEQKKLIDVNDVFDKLGKGTEAAGLLVKAISVISLTANAQLENEGPVQKKIAEFQRNVALYDILFQAEKFALNIAKDVIPALGAVTSGIDMFKAAIEAARYFKMLADISKLKDSAKSDPKTVVYLPLVRMAKLKRIEGAEKVLAFVENALVSAGKITQLSGVGAVVGLAVDVSGKIVAQGGKFVFANIKWSDAKKAQKNILKAKGPPIDREAIELVFKFSNKYATYCLALAALEDNDPWAVRYCLQQGLTQEEIKDENTSVQVLRKYIVIKNNVDDEQKTFSQDTLIGQALTKTKDGFSLLGAKISDKAAGRNTSIAYEPPDVGGVPNLNYKDLKVLPQDLKRDTWQATKKDAKELGWYDDRSKLGDELDAFASAQKNWFKYKKGQDKFIEDPTEKDLVEAEVYGQAIQSLSRALAYMRPLANDQRTVHLPMKKAIDAMMRLVDDAELDFQSEYSAMKEVFNSKQGNVQTDSFEDQVKKRKEEINNQQSAIDLKLAELIKDQAWDTPFGSCKLDAYLDLVCKRLSVNKNTIETEFNAAIETLKATVLYLDARDVLGSYTLEELPSAFKKCLPSLKKTASEALTTLALLAKRVRDQVFQQIAIMPAISEVSLRAWTDALSQAPKDMKPLDNSNIVDYLAEYQVQYDKFKARGNELYQSMAISKLRLAAKEIAKLRPVDADGLPFEPMVDFCERFTAKIAAKIEEIEKEKQPGWQPEPFKDAPKDWEKWWSDNKGAAVKRNLDDKKTGVSKSLPEVLLRYEAYTNATSKNPNLAFSEELHTPLLKALDNLASCIQKFEPVTKGGKSLPGAVKMKAVFLQKVAEARKKITDAAAPTYTVPVPTKIDDVTEENWSKAKKEYIHYGLVKGKTGLGKAIKGFVSHKAKHTKSKATNFSQEYKDAANLLIKVARTSLLKDACGNPFEPAVKHAQAIAKLIDDHLPK